MTDFPQEVSPTALEKPIFNETRDFFPTWKEWAVQNRELIFERGAVTTDTTILTVPSGFKAYITSAFLAAQATAINGAAHLEIVDAGVSSVFFTFLGHSGMASGAHASDAISFDMPIQIEEGLVIRANVSNATTIFHITGWLEPKLKA